MTISISLSPSLANYLNSEYLLNSLKNNLGNTADYEIISLNNNLNNIENNINPDIVDTYEKQVNLPTTGEDLKTYNPSFLNYQTGINLLQYNIQSQDNFSSIDNLVQIGNQLNLLKEGVLASYQNFSPIDIFEIANDYSFLNEKISSTEIENLLNTNSSLLQNILIYSYNPQSGISKYPISNLLQSTLDVKG
ncbi:MAG: hypothetical protein ACPLRZ_08370 [Thermovenabulum sp.]|uniref:hypothetical protein n=1 Tax=Thermovenabulum sp. TaxID=3100335 RepID=UPI003C7B3777